MVSPREFYNDFASTYDSTLENPKVNAQHVYEAAKIFLRNNSDYSGSVLDIGCGTGQLKEILNRDFEYTGIDIAEKMLYYASQRGYKTIHKPVEEALFDIPDCSYDFVFALSSLLCVENIQHILKDINRISRKSVLLSLDNVTQEYKNTFVVPVHDHSKVVVLNAKEDYIINGWTSPTTGIAIQTRMIYVEK